MSSPLHFSEAPPRRGGGRAGASSFGPPPARPLRGRVLRQSGEAPLAAGGEPYIAIQIYGIEHEFSTLLGVRESVLDIIANLEAVRYQITKPLTKPKIAFCNFYGPGILQAKHIHFPSGLKCIQPSQYIATVEIDGKLIFKLFFSSTKLNAPQRGALNERVLPKRGEPEESRSPFLVIQTPHSIVEKVNYTMLPSGALFFEVWTNGSMHPQNAILNAINKLLLEIFPYSKKISSLREPCPFLLNEKLLNLEVSNFYFNLETYLFFKKKGIHRVIDFLNFWKNNTDIDLSLRVPVTRRPMVAPPREAEGGERGEQRDLKPRAIFKGFTPPEARGGAELALGAQSIFKFFNYIANLNIDPLGSILTFNLQQEYELRRNSMLFQFHQEDSEQVQQHVLE
uniref:RNA polymerase a-subunit n=1 Tax=Halimeda minima TaxID=170427 RepID=A0A386AYV0_9CHLO|nr:RNA polymerase a-subunit [Halimeda minima]